MSEKVKLSDTTSKKKSTPIKKTTEERKLKNKTSQNASSATPQRRNSAPARSARGKFDGPRMRLKGLPPPSPKEKPKVSKEHGPRRKDMRAFVIPRKAKEKELLEEVSLDSNSFQKYLLPAVVQQYRDPTSRASFEYEKAFLVHNDKLNTEFQERRKEMKEDGRSDREVAEQYAFLLVDNMNIAKLICQDGLHVRWTGQSREHRLGHGDMGVYLNRFSDILSATSLGTGKEHILLVFKVLKGKVKAVPLTHHKQAMEPTPKFDSHVAKNIVVDLTSSRVQTFVSNQIYCYQFGDLEMAKRPQQVCPFALVYFKYTERKKESTSLGGAFDVTTKKDVTRKEEDITKGTKKPALYTTVYSPPITLWKGKLINGGKEHCSACLVSSRLPFLPTDLPRRLNLNTALPISKVKQIMPSNISKHPKLCHFSRYREVSAKGRYFSYAQMRRIGDKTAFLELFKCLKENDMALQKKIDNKLLFVLPPCTLTEELGITKSVKTCVLHVLFVSNRSSFRILTDIGLKKAASRAEDEKPQLPVVSQSQTANCKADIGKVFQHMTSFYSGEKVKKKTPLRSAIRNSVSESKDPPSGEVSKDGNNRNITTDTVLKDATNSIVKDMKPSQNHLPQVVEAPQTVSTVGQVPFHSGRLEHVEGSFSPIEEDSPPPPQTQQDPRTLTKDTSDESNRARVKQGDKQGGSSELQDEQKFTYPPKPTRMFSQNSALPDINHKINQLTELVKVKEKIVSMSASSSDVSGTTEAVKGYQTRISELKGNLEMLLQERAGLKQAEQLKVSFQRQRVAEKLKALSPAVQMPTFSAEQDSIGMVTPNPSLSQHQPTTPDHSTYDYFSANESEPYFNSPDGEFPAQPPLVMDLDRKPIQESAQIFDYLKNILSSPHLQQQDIPPEEPGGESPVGPDPLSPAGLTLDSLRSILGRVQGQSPSGSGFPFPHSLMQQYPEVSEGLDPGPSTSYDTSMTSDVENNNKRQVEDGGGYLSSSKRLRTGDAGDPMTKLASILSTVSRNTTSSSVPATPQSPPPWETLSLVHKEIPPETPESPPPWDKCNELSAMDPQVGSEAQWSRNVIVKGDLNDQLTVTIKGPPVSNQSQGGPPDLYALVKSVLHGITRKFVKTRGALKPIPGSGLAIEYEISPPTQQEVHLQEIVLNTLHTQNPGNSQIQYGALRKVQEVARPLTHEKQRSISQRSSPRQVDSPRGSVSTSSNHSPSPPPKSDSGRSKSSIIEDGTSFQGDLTSEDGVSVGQPSYYHRAKDQRHSPSSRSKVPKHRSDITNEGNGFVVRTLERQHLVVRRQTSHKLSFRATIPFSTPKNRKHSVCNKYSKTSNKLNCHKKKRKSKKKAYLREKSPQMYLCMKDHTLKNTGAHLKENVQQTLTLERKREKIEQPLTCKGGDEHLKEKLLQPLTPEGAGVHMKEKLLQPLTLGGGDEHVKEKLLQPPFLGGGDEHVKEKLLQPPFLGGGDEHVKEKLLQPPFLGGGDEHVEEKLLQPPFLGGGDEHVEEKLLQPPFLGGGDEHLREKLLQPPFLGGHDEDLKDKLLQPPTLVGAGKQVKEKLLQHLLRDEGACVHSKEMLQQLHTFETPGKEDNLGYEIISGSDDCSGLLDMSFSDDNSPSPEIEVNFVYKEVDCVKKLEDGNARLRGNSKVEIRSVSHLMDGIYDKHGEMQPDRITHEDEKCLAKAPGCKIYNTGSEMYEEQTLANVASDVPGLPGTDCDSSSSLYTKMHTLSDLDRSDVQQTSKIDNGIVLFASSDQREVTKNIKTCEDQGPTHVQSLGSIEVNDQFVSNSRVLHQDESRKLTASENNSHHKLTPQGYDDEDGSRDTSHCSDDTSSLHNSFLLPSDPLATYLDFFDTAALDTATTNRISMDDTTDLDSCENSPIQSSFPSCDSHIVTPIRQTKGDGKLLSILFGTALKSPAAIAFKCSASQSSSVSSNVEHSEFDGNLKKQTIEEKFFQNQRFLKTTFNRPNGLLHQEMMTLISDNDLEGDEDPVLPCSSGNSRIPDDPFEKSTPLLHGKLHPQPYHPDITANWQSRGMQVGMNFFKEAENSQQKYFLHTAATNKDMIGKKSVPVIDSTSYSPSKHPNSRNQYHQEVNQVFHNDTLPTKDLPDYECAGTEPGGHSGDDETISTPEIMRMLDEQLEGYQQLDRGTGQDICEGRDTKKNLNGCSKEDPLHFVENKCFSSEPSSNEVGKKTSWKEKQGLNASDCQLQPAVFPSGAMASLQSRCNSEGTVMDSTNTEPKDVDSDIGKGTESILTKLPDQQRKRQNVKMRSPERLSSPNNLENKKELKSLVDELRTETLKKLKKHAGKVAKDLMKIRGFRVSKKEDGFKGTKWHLKWRVKDTKERRKKMKPKKLRQASRRQNPEEVQRAVLCLNDLACKVSRCSIDGGATVVSSSLVEAGRRKFESKILSTCHSPLKIPGTSPRTLPFKKDFTTSLLHRNVFGSFSAEGIGSSSPSRLTLIKTVQNTYKILSKRIKIASALKSATFVHRSLFSRQKKRSPVQTKEHCQENNKLDDKYCLKNGTDMHQCEDRSRCDNKTFVQQASSSQSQQGHQVQISNGYRNPPQPYNQLLLPLKLGRTTEHSLSHQPKESSTFSSVNQDTASLTSNPLTRFTSSSPRHLPYSSPYFTPAVRAPYILQPNLYLSLVQQQPLLHFMRGAFTSLNFTTLRQSDVNGIQRKMNGGVTESPVGIPREPRASDIQKSKEGHLWESDIVKTPKSSAVIGHGLPGNQRQISKSVCKSVKPVEEPELSLIDKVPSPPTSSDDGFFNVLKPVEHLTEKERKEVPPNLEFVTSEISQCSSFQGSSEADNQNVVDMVTLRGNDKHVTSVAGDVNKSGEKSEQECSLKMLSSHDLCGKGKQLPIISSDDASTTDEILTEEVIAKVSMSATKEGINRIMTSITTRDDKVPSVKVREGQTEDMLNKGIDSITTQKQEKVNSSPKKCSHANYADRRDNVNCEGQYKPCLICKDVCEDKTCVNVSSEEQVNIGSIPTHSASEVSNQLGENLSQNIGINDGEVSSCNGFQVDSAPESLLVLKTKKDTTGLENSGLSYNSHMTRWDSLSSKHYAKCEANVMTNESTPCPIQQPVEEFVHKESSSYTDEFSMKKCDPVHGCATASKSLVVNESVSQVDTSSGKMNNQTQGVVIEEKTGIKEDVDKIVSSGNILQNCKADVCTLGKDAHFDKVGLKTEEVRYMPSSAEPICTSIEDKSMQENVEVMRKHDINYTLTKTETCMPSTSSYDTVTVATMNGCLLSNDTHQTKDHCSPVLKSHGSSTCDDNVASLENDQTETVCGSSTTKENVNQELDGLAVSVDDDILSLGDNDSIDEFLLFEDSLDSFKAEEDQIDTDNVVKCSKTLNGNSLSGLVMRKSDEQTCDEPPRKVIVKDMTNSGGDELKSKPIVADDKGRQLFAKADSGGITKNVPPPIRDYSFGDTSDEAVTSLKVGSKSELSSKSIKSTIEKPPKKKSKKKKKSKISGSEIDVDKQTTSRRRVAITKQLLPNTVKPKLKVLHGTNEKSGVGEGIHVKETKRVVTFKSPTKKGKGQRAMNTSPKSTKGVDNLQKRKCGTSSPLAAKKMKLAFLPSMPLERGFQIPKLGTKGKDNTKTKNDVKPSSMITSVDPNLRTVKINLKTAVVQLQRLRTELRNTKKVSKDATDTSSTIGNQVSYLKGDNCVDKTGQNAQCKTTDSLKEDVIIKDKSPVSNQRLSEVYSGQLKTPTRTNSWTVVDEVGLSPVTLKSSIVVPLPKATVSNKVYQTSGQVRTGSKAAPPDDLTTATEAKLGAEKKNLQEENSSKVEHREREPCVEEKNQSGTQGSVVKLTDTQRIESLVGVVVSDTQKKERNEAAVGDKQNKESISVETNLTRKATEVTGVSTIKGNEESQAERKVPGNIRKVEIVKQVDKKPARIVTSESKGKDKQLPSSSSSSSSGKSKPSTTRPSRRFHPYVPSQIDASRLVHWRRLKQPNMKQLMWDHTFMSPKIRRNSPPKDIFSALNTAQGRFKSMGDLKHQESLLKNAEECEPESTPGEVTNAKKSRAKTLDINILKLAADTNDIQQLLELDEMVYTLQSQQFPSRPLQVPHSVRYHPYY